MIEVESGRGQVVSTWELQLEEQFQAIVAALRAREVDPLGEEEEVLIGLSRFGATVIHCLQDLQRAPERFAPGPIA
ncbi:MAG: hypothetical protein AB7N76_29165 [Planctomycetota bacterium]